MQGWLRGGGPGRLVDVIGHWRIAGFDCDGKDHQQSDEQTNRGRVFHDRISRTAIPVRPSGSKWPRGQRSGTVARYAIDTVAVKAKLSQTVGHDLSECSLKLREQSGRRKL